MRIPRLVMLSVAAVLAACSSSKTTGTVGGTGTPGGASGTPAGQDPGVTGPAGDIQGHDANPAGVAYPTANIGYTPRKGDKAGNVISNYKFLGYPESDKSKGLQPVALADYFDPTGKDVKIIHISVSGVWCYWCKEETKALIPLVPELKAKKVVYLTALSEDAYHKPAVQKDLDYWVNTYHTNYTQVLDPGNAQLGPFFDAAAIPWNANLDASTMEILSAGVGAPSPDGVTIDILSDVQPWLDWYAKNHPGR